ncbi:MAG: TauD/TfdA family dioxygenase [Gammaproteobacteria bacterium]|nr:TauD/TfdA family dioxygenase [Gammaproteobacteria bacterium]
MSIEINRLEPALGAEVSGVDLSGELDDETFADIHQAFVDHSVLVFRGQALDPVAQLAFSNRFGLPERHVISQFALPDHPDVFVVSNLTRDGKLRGAIRAGQFWHSDCSYMERPTLASFLHALEVPSSGGDTMFTSMAAAHDALSESMRGLLAGLRAVHDYTYAYETYFSKFPDRPPLTAEQIARVPPVVHPVIRTHPESGRRALYVSPGFTRRIEDLEESESAALLAFLFTHATRPEFVYRHNWRAGDLVVWDNRATLHCAIADYDMREPRHMHRTSVQGDRPH